MHLCGVALFAHCCPHLPQPAMDGTRIKGSADFLCSLLHCAERYAHLTSSILLLHADFLDGPLEPNIERLRYSGTHRYAWSLPCHSVPLRVAGACRAWLHGWVGSACRCRWPPSLAFLPSLQTLCPF
jgi:hypothetical protein